MNIRESREFSLKRVRAGELVAYIPLGYREDANGNIACDIRVVTVDKVTRAGIKIGNSVFSRETGRIIKTKDKLISRYGEIRVLTPKLRGEINKQMRYRLAYKRARLK